MGCWGSCMNEPMSYLAYILDNESGDAPVTEPTSGWAWNFFMFQEPLKEITTYWGLLLRIYQDVFFEIILGRFLVRLVKLWAGQKWNIWKLWVFSNAFRRISFQALRVVIVALSEIVKRAPRSLVVKDHVTMNKPVVSLYFLLIYQVMCILTWKHNGANRQAFQVLKS